MRAQFQGTVPFAVLIYIDLKPMMLEVPFVPSPTGSDALHLEALGGDGDALNNVAPSMVEVQQRNQRDKL